MKVGPSESPCRRRLQTAISCFGPKTAVVNVMVKRRDRIGSFCREGKVDAAEAKLRATIVIEDLLGEQYPFPVLLDNNKLTIEPPARTTNAS
jgi:hypothetical protein